MSEAETIQASNRSAIARMYGVTLRILNDWIETNPELKKTVAPYLKANKKSFPPSVVKKFFDILGEP